MEPQLVGGLFDGLISGLLSDAKLDLKKLITHPKFKEAIACFAVALKDSASLPLGLDDKIIDKLVEVLNKLLDETKNMPPVVGAHPVARLTKEEVEEMIRSEGGDPTQFAPFILILLQVAPLAIQIIRWWLGK